MKSQKLASAVRIAKAFGVSRMAVLKWMKKPEWSQLGRGPWTAGAIQAWRDRVLVGQNMPAGTVLPESGGDPLAGLRANPVRAAQLRLAIARAVLLEMDAKIRSGELVRREDAQREELERAARARSELMALTRSLPPRLRGIADEARQAELIAEAVTDALAHLAGGGNGQTAAVKREA